MVDLSERPLYFIADYRPGINRYPLEYMVSQAIAGGVDLIQLRYKNSRKSEFIKAALSAVKITSVSNIPLIINDDPIVALAVGAEGVHLGQEDMPVEEARELLGHERIIGLSTHSVEEAIKAEKRGADYIGVGPVFHTETKQPARSPIGPEILKEIGKRVKIPFYPIGGVNHDNIDQIIANSADRAAVASFIGEADNIKPAARSLKSKLITNQFNDRQPATDN